MALSPSIPTSFVPKQPVSPGKKHYSSGNNIFLVISIVIVGLTIVAAVGVFLYSKYLTSVEQAKGAELIAAQNSVNESTVQQFVELRDRLSAAKQLVSTHVELSQFFSLLQSITLQNVYFTALKVQVADDNSAIISMTGVAKDFNALAAESATFAAQKNIQSAIFSGISVNSNGTVGFTIDATLAPGLVTESAPPTSPVILSGSSTPATAPSFVSSSPTTASTSAQTTPVTSPASTTAP